MAGLFDPLTRADRQHAADNVRIAGFRADLEKLAANKPSADDFGGLVGHDAAVAEVQRKIKIAEGVAAHSKGILEREQTAAEVRAASEKHTQMQRNAHAAVPRLEKLFVQFKKLQPELAWLAKHVDEYASYNADLRGTGRALVKDAEVLLRQQPEKHLPQILGTIEVWVDKYGREPSQYVERGGEMTPTDHGDYKKITREICRQTATTIPAQMPERLTDAIRLFDVDGTPIWPIR